MPGSCLETVIRTRISGTPNDIREYKINRNRIERGVISLRRGMKYLWKWNEVEDYVPIFVTHRFRNLLILFNKKNHIS